MKLRLKLILPIILITAVMAVLTVYLITDDLEQDALIRAQQVTAEYIIAKARERLTMARALRAPPCARARHAELLPRPRARPEARGHPRARRRRRAVDRR